MKLFEYGEEEREGNRRENIILLLVNDIRWVVCPCFIESLNLGGDYLHVDGTIFFGPTIRIIE